MCVRMCVACVCALVPHIIFGMELFKERGIVPSVNAFYLYLTVNHPRKTQDFPFLYVRCRSA